MQASAISDGPGAVLDGRPAARSPRCAPGARRPAATSRTVGDGGPEVDRGRAPARRTRWSQCCWWSPTSWPVATGDVDQTRTGRPWRASRRPRPARRCRRAPAWRGSCPRCATVTARAVRHQTRVTSRPVSKRTRSKLCTPVWSMMPPPETLGTVEPVERRGLEALVHAPARAAARAPAGARAARRRPCSSAACAPSDTGRRRRAGARTIAAASAPVVASGFSIRSGFRAAATASAIARCRLGGTTAITPATAGSATRSRQSAWNAAAELACLAPRRARRPAATERDEPQLRHVGPDVLQVALPVLAGADDADGNGNGRHERSLLRCQSSRERGEPAPGAAIAEASGAAALEVVVDRAREPACARTRCRAPGPRGRASRPRGRSAARATRCCRRCRRPCARCDRGTRSARSRAPAGGRGGSARCPTPYATERATSCIERVASRRSARVRASAASARYIGEGEAAEEQVRRQRRLGIRLGREQLLQRLLGRHAGTAQAVTAGRALACDRPRRAAPRRTSARRGSSSARGTPG